MSDAVAEFVTLRELTEAAPEWADLCARAAEPNPFAEPGFLLPLLTYERPRLAFVLVREGGRLSGFTALKRPFVGLARVWMSAYAALPAAALDRERTPAALAALLALLAERTRLAGLIWPFVEAGGPLSRLPGRLVRTRRRVALRLQGAAAFDAGLDAKRAKKWARQGRKLAGMGRFEIVAGPEAVEAFFAVEGKGWKGARGTALADDPARLAFARAALEAFAQAGRLDALALRLDDNAVAAGLVLIAGDRAFYWKTAYDEAFAETSPGVQLTLAHSRRLAETPGLALVDSCAAEDHPMIGRVWGDGLEFEDWVLGLRPGGERALGVWLGLGMSRAHARNVIKSWLNSLRSR